MPVIVTGCAGKTVSRQFGDPARVLACQACENA
jgi:hypothetical protein